MTQYIILVPYGARTGGPEAQHQLAKLLIDAGQQAGIYYYTNEELLKIKKLALNGTINKTTTIELAARNNPIIDYNKYNVPSITKIRFDSSTILVLGEPLLDLVPALINSGVKFLITWLSFDFSLKILSTMNLNYLRTPRTIHTCQSEYARSVVKSLGMGEPLLLTDYTVLPDDQLSGSSRSNVLSKENMILVGAHPKKTIYNVQKLISSWQNELNCEIKLCSGMNRLELDMLMRRAKIYVELGNNPGKDRMPREALLNQCLVYCIRAGASYEYRLPEDFYFDIEAINNLTLQLKKSLVHYESQLLNFQTSIELVRQECRTFTCQVNSLIRTINSVWDI